MLSLSCAVWAWLAESANILLDLANVGRDAHNVIVIAVAATLAVIRIAAFLIFTIPALAWLKRQIWPTRERRHRDEWVVETGFRAFVIVLIIASIAFEFWAKPKRTNAEDAENGTRIENGGSYDDYDGM